MTSDEVRAMSVKQLQIRAAELGGWKPPGQPDADIPDGGRAASEPPDYPGDWSAAMELFELARSGRCGFELYDFIDAVESLIDDKARRLCVGRLSKVIYNRPELVIFGHLAPMLITQAFVLAWSKAEAVDEQGEDRVE